MAGAIHLAGQNMIQVMIPKRSSLLAHRRQTRSFIPSQVYAPHIDPTSARKVLRLLLGPHQLAQRSELVLWGQVNDGKNLTPLHVEHQLKHALQALDLTTLDLAVIQVSEKSRAIKASEVVLLLKRAANDLVFLLLLMQSPHNNNLVSFRITD